MKTYATGVPCRRGHDAPRTKARGECTECRRLKAIAFRKKYPEKSRDKTKIYPPGVAKKRRAWRAKDAKRRAWRAGAKCACCPGRRISMFYAACATGFEVDHRIPLAMGGKHCTLNLQFLTVAAHKLKTAQDMANIRAYRAVQKLLTRG